MKIGRFGRLSSDRNDANSLRDQLFISLDKYVALRSALASR